MHEDSCKQAYIYGLQFINKYNHEGSKCNNSIPLVKARLDLCFVEGQLWGYIVEDNVLSYKFWCQKIHINEVFSEASNVTDAKKFK